MYRTTLTIVCLLAALTTVGCANFSKYAPKMEAVAQETEMIANSPSIDLKQDATDSGGAVGAAMNIAAASEGVKAAKILRSLFDRNIDPETIDQSLNKGLKKALSDGQPFQVTDEGKDGTLRIKVYSYGVERTGTTPTFTGTYLVRVNYAAESKKVYKGRVQCEEGGFFEETDANVVQASGFKTAVESMSDEDFMNRYQDHIDKCTAKIARKLRKAAN